VPPHCAISWPPPRSASRRRANQARVVAQPVERRRREDRVDVTTAEVELLEVLVDQLDAVAQAHARRREHLGGPVDADHPAVRQALDQRLGDAARAAAGVEHGLVAAQLQAVEHLAADPLERRRDAVVCRSVAILAWHTNVCYRG
jgi:hypothetical protein